MLNFMQRACLIVSLILLAIAVSALCPARAETLPAEHQMIATVLLRQNTNEAQVTLSVVDAGPSHKYNVGIFRRGVIIADDGGRAIALRGEAVLDRQGRTFQIFRFDDAHLDLPGTKVIRVTHISFLIMTGDFAHPSFICGSPSLSIDACLEQWKTTN